jgi:two-component system sensor histidine kinase/response regulator
MKIITLLIFLATILDASYLRTIRIGSFVKNSDAQEALVELNKFVQEHEVIVKLQKEWNFEFKTRKSGRYYITLVEPFTNRDVLQKVLDTIRLGYKDVYVTKLKSTSLVQKKPKVITDKKDINISKIITSLKERKITKPAPPKVKDRPKSVIVEKKDLNKKYLDTTLKLDKDSKDNYLWQILFAIIFFLLLACIRILLKYKRENEAYLNQEIIQKEQFKQLYKEMKNKENFLSHASHELRTPMTAIMGLTHLVLEGDLAPYQKDYVQKIESSAKNLLNIVNDILDISKIQAGELKIEKTEFNLNDILDYVLTTISMQVKNNNIDIAMDIDSDVPSHIIGDSLRLGQVLINLLANAVKFTKDGEVSLSVKKLSSYGSGITLEFSVSDTGIGMTESQAENIFKSYSQANDDTSRKFGGTGLGLFISKQLVEMMNGEIKVSSKKNVGTTFTFNVLFKLKDSQNKRHYRLPSSTLLGKRVLIVDPSNKNVISLIRTFGYFNYKTHSIPSFKEAILEDSMLFDIMVVSQAVLTKFNIDKIKEIQSKTPLKIVVLSELYSNLSSDLLESLEIDAYLKLPFTQQSILNVIIELYVSKNLDNRSRKKNIKDKLKEMSGKKILIAEDNKLNHKVLLGLLSQTGIEATFVLNGREAIDMLHQGIKFDLILMDINMPVMNGYEASIEIRKDKKYNNLPILALTADVMQESIEKAYESGMQGHIAKPIIIDIFYQKVLDALRDKILKPSAKLKKSEGSSEEKAEFEELSVSIGLERCDNDTEFYKSILQDFKIMYLSSPLRLEKLSKEEKFKEARHLAMDIKDVALNIGAYNICESAAMMEYEFEKASKNSSLKLIKFYAASLDKLILDIDNYLKKLDEKSYE